MSENGWCPIIGNLLYVRTMVFVIADPPQLSQLQIDLDVVLPIEYCLGIGPYSYAVNYSIAGNFDGC